MADDQNLSQQDIQDLQEIASKLPTGHPAQKKIALLLSSQPTQFEQNITGDTGHTVGKTISNIGHIVGGALTSGSPAAPENIIRNTSQIATDAAARSAEGRSPAYNLAATSANIAGIPTRPMEEAANRGDTSGVYAGALAPAIVAGTPLIREGLGATRNAIGRTMFAPTGDAFTPSTSPTGSGMEYAFKPGAKTAVRIAGGAVGAVPGILKGNPYEAFYGGSAGAALGPSMAEAIFKPSAKPVYPGAFSPSASDFYANRAEEVNSANKQAAQVAKAQAKIPAWEQPAHDVLELGSPENPGPFSKIPNRLPPSMRGDPFSPPTGETTSGLWEPNDEMLRRGAAGENTDLRSIRRQRMQDAANEQDDLISRMKKIARPGEAPTSADLKRAGDFTQVSADKLRTLARFGDKLAQNELNRRLKQ